MNRSFETPSRLPLTGQALTQWANSRETADVVAAAIFAISDSKRSPEAIWEAPTNIEFDTVTMAVEEYLTQGDFEPSDDGKYEWGEETITVEIPNS